MTGDAPVLDRPALWAALSHMQIATPRPGTRFEDMLAGQQGWTVGFAERVTDEYCGFLYLAATAGFELTPSQAVDQAWHLHLTLPHYEEVLCRQVLGRTLRHLRAMGEPGEHERHRRQYEETVELYKQTFGKAPPTDIWPRPIPEEERQDTSRRRARRRASAFAIGAAVAATGAQAFGLLVLALTLGGGALIFLLLTLPTHPSEARTRGGGDAGCGGGAAGDHCAGCGGSCGGGGCGGGCGD